MPNVGLRALHSGIVERTAERTAERSAHSTAERSGLCKKKINAPKAAGEARKGNRYCLTLPGYACFCLDQPGLGEIQGAYESYAP